MAHRISAARIQEAYRQMRPIYKDTPQYRSEGLSRLVSADLLLKVETLNPIGSFKGRGICWWFHCRPGLKGIVCASAGNLGQAAAWEGRQAGIPVHVFASELADAEKVRAMRNLGAVVHLQGMDFDEAKAHAERFAAIEGIPLLVDGRDVEISEGLGTLGLELLRHHADLERVYLPIGNGALINGTASWFRQNLSRTKVIGVCAAGAPSMQLSFRNKRLCSTDAATTIADGIAVRAPVPEAVEDMLAVVDDVLLVDDGEIRDAMRLLLDQERLLVEPSGAAALAGALKDRKSHPWKSACAVVTGSNLGAADSARSCPRREMEPQRHRDPGPDVEAPKSPYFTAAHATFRHTVRRFIEENVLPFADLWEAEGRMPRQLWESMGRAGFLGLNHAAELGGGSPDFFYSVVYLEELGRAGYAGFRGAFSVHSYMALEYLSAAGSEALKRKYLAPAIAGRKIAALALTERESGSDLASIATIADPQGEGYRINGSKIFVTNGLLSDFIITSVRTPRPGPEKGGKSSVSLFVVDADSAGIEKHEIRKIGWYCSDTAEVVFKDVWVPKANLIGNLNAGFYTIMKCLQVERLAAALVSLGGVDLCLELTRNHLATRTLFGKTLNSFQAVRHRMADLYSQVEAARQLLYHTAWLYEQKEIPFLECSMSKLRITELANQVADECLQFHGGYGYLADSPISRIYRDTRLATIVGGASEVMRDLIAEVTLGQPRLHPASP